MYTITKDQWRIWTPIGSWWYDTDLESTKRMKKKYAELLARYPNMEVKKERYKTGDQIW